VIKLVNTLKFKSKEEVEEGGGGGEK